eukprot:TRINITY_DN14416_c0_g1_i2.p1 TRINITY_DN14416_c0_g1~~TRINITY_DN14416_c0_g1_i2.p1  ORF type:complete len:160 (+),score=35.66 TRINITY_DN14416_c0_g1_i2:12-491(+)
MGNSQKKFIQALKDGKSDVAEKYILGGIEINSENEWEIMYYACSKASFKVIKLLVEKGANPSYGVSSACERGDIELVQYLYDQGGTDSGSGLSEAVLKNYVSIIAFLLKHGSSANTCDRYEKPLLCIAAQMKNVDIVKLLLHHDAQVDCHDKNNRTPME